MPEFTTPLSRRTLLVGGLGIVATAALTACTAPPQFVRPGGAAVAAAEKARGSGGALTKVALRAAPLDLDLAGVTAKTWGFGAVPGPIIRVVAGDTLEATLDNGLPEHSSLHWHGLALRNDMDGVPPATQPAIAAGETFTYRFIAENPGTYWFHPHMGPQLDRGLYGALIVDDPHEPLAYDEEWVVILDDWLDGVTATPDEVLAELKGSMGAMGGGFMQHGNRLMGAKSKLLDGDAGDVFYPYYLVNGRPPADPEVYASAPGRKVRIRIINAGAETAFRVALGGHRMTVTHSDGYAVEQVETDALLLGMGERYDVLVTLGDGAFPFVAAAEGKRDRAFAIVRTASGAAPSPAHTVDELEGHVLVGADLVADTAVQLADHPVDRELTLKLTGTMMGYAWSINDRPFDMDDPFAGALSVREGERVRLHVENWTRMWHPFHLHGHTYQHVGGPRKDTSIVLPYEKLLFDFDADNPGVWAAHCHNIYHAEAGMMTLIGYEA